MRRFLAALPAALTLGACASTLPAVTAAPAPAPAAAVSAMPAPAAPALSSIDDTAARAARERARAAATLAADRAALESVLYFDYDRDALRPDVVAALDRVSDVLRRHVALTIRLVGNADDRGSDEYNLALGQRRAAAAKRWLVDHGIRADRIDVSSLGREHPVCTDEAESCWEKNRRDEVTITHGGDTLGATEN